MKDWIVKYWPQLLFIFTALGAAVRKFIKAQCANDKGISALLRIELYRMCNEVEKQGYITQDQMELLDGLYQPYHAKRQNGVGTRFYQRVMNMPHREHADVLGEDERG